AKLTRNKNEGIDMAPTVYDGMVYVSTVPGNAKGFYKGNGVGRLFGLDADSGNQTWVFNTVPEDLWDARYKDVNSGGGLSYSPAGRSATSTRPMRSRATCSGRRRSGLTTGTTTTT